MIWTDASTLSLSYTPSSTSSLYMESYMHAADRKASVPIRGPVLAPPLLVVPRRLAQALPSPIRCKCSIRTIAFGKPSLTVSISTVGRVKPAAVRRVPTSAKSTNGPTCVDTPPSRSISARTNDDRSSLSVDPPIMANMRHPSGLRTRLASARRPGKSFTQWIEAALRTRSNVPSGKGSLVSSSAWRRYVEHRSDPSNASASASASASPPPPPTPMPTSRFSMASDESSWTSLRTPPMPPGPSNASSLQMVRWTYPGPDPTSSARGKPPSRRMSSSRSTRREAISSRK
mmetsp:Transcript_26827/g.77361  ORF Transcript_26827/g.77361 Transcript_26827/m.77361 type:complete len:288 (-) Transcript_26827:72-935(-)